MVYSAGKGTHEFVLNREGEYVLSEENITLDEKGSIYSLGGLRKEWLPGHLKFVEILEGEGYKLRYSGGFVPDINQILIKRGGVFTYPGTKKDLAGKLRLIFELQPMAFLAWPPTASRTSWPSSPRASTTARRSTSAAATRWRRQGNPWPDTIKFPSFPF
jgi:fructose-1,6-bisphosphatase